MRGGGRGPGRPGSDSSPLAAATGGLSDLAVAAHGWQPPQCRWQRPQGRWRLIEEFGSWLGLPPRPALACQPGGQRQRPMGRTVDRPRRQRRCLHTAAAAAGCPPAALPAPRGLLPRCLLQTSRKTRPPAARRGQLAMIFSTGALALRVGIRMLPLAIAAL